MNYNEVLNLCGQVDYADVLVFENHEFVDVSTQYLIKYLIITLLKYNVIFFLPCHSI